MFLPSGITEAELNYRSTTDRLQTVVVKCEDAPNSRRSPKALPAK
jgi:hypothetical protein